MDVNFDNDRPIYIQLVELLKKCIVSGKIKPGDRMPSVREFASTFKVNPNTVQKSLQELEFIGLIYTERTNGKYITSDNKLIESIRLEFAKDLVSDYLSDMESIGFNKSDAIKYLERIDK